MSLRPARARVLILTLLLVALGLRIAPLARHGGEGLAEPGLLFGDPASAYQVRRVAVGLAQGLIPTADRYLAHPSGAEPPHGPVLAGLLSLLAPGRPGERAGAGSLDTQALERRLALAGPLLGLLLVGIGMAAAGRLAAPGAAGGGITRPGAWGRSGPGPPLLAAAVLALAPVLVVHGQAGRLSVELLTALLLAAQAGLLASSLQARERVDRLGAALAAGLVGGLALATSPLASLGALAGWVALWRGSRDREGGRGAEGPTSGGGPPDAMPDAMADERADERADDARRAGLLYLLAMAVVAQIPRWGGPWAPSHGAGARFAALVIALALLACVPFLVDRLAGAGARALRRPTARIAGASLVGILLAGALLAGALLAGALLLDLRGGLAEPLAGALGLGPGAWSSAALARPWPLLLPLPVLPLVLLGPARLRADPAALHVALLASLAGCAALLSTAAEPLAWTALALVVAAAAAVSLAPAGSLAPVESVAPVEGVAPVAAVAPVGTVAPPAIPARGALGAPSPRIALALILAALVPGLRALLEEQSGSRARRDRVASLRALAGVLPSPGPWTTARAPQAFGVLAEPDLALLATWHARLPAVGTPYGSSESGSPGWRALSSLADSTVETLPMVLASAHARFLIADTESVEALQRRMGPGAGFALGEVLAGRRDGLREIPAAGSPSRLVVLELAAEERLRAGEPRLVPAPDARGPR